MILYHTSDREIISPDIRRGRKNADFGWGFYLTPDKEFTYRWARENAVVNEYEFDESGLNIKRFTRSLEWYEYIFNNRRLTDGVDADAVLGPIANDTIFDTMGIITSGYLKPEDALRLLMIGPEYVQVAIKSEKALANLKWVRSQRIERENAEEFRKEQDAFLQRFAEEMDIMSGEE